jgi:WD40 repeat protein
MADEQLTMVLATLLIGLVGLALFFLFYLSSSNKKKITNRTDEKKKRNEELDDEEDKTTGATTKKDKNNEKKSTSKPKFVSNSNKNKFTHAVNQKDHPLFWKEIGGHVTSSCCITFSPKNSLVASASKDGTIRCLPLSDVGVASPLEIFTNIGEAPSALCFTQNAKRLVVAVNGVIKFYSLLATDSERKFELLKSLSTGMRSISSVQLMDVEQWMVVIVCGINEGNEPCVRAFDRQGTRLANLIQIPRKGRVDKTRLSLASRALVSASPDDRFLAVYGVGEAEGVKDGEVGIFEVIRDKISGHATGLRLAIALSGHTAHVTSCGWNSTGQSLSVYLPLSLSLCLSVSLSPSSSLKLPFPGKQFVTCCQNGQWRIWDTTVRYSEYELPRLYSNQQTLPNNILPTHVSLMRNNLVVLVAGSDIYYCALGSGEVVQHISEATVGPISSIAVSADGQYVATVVENVKRIALWTTPS